MHNSVSDQLRKWVQSALSAENVGARRFEETHGLKKWALRGFLDPERKQSPSLDRAKEICEALGLEFYIGPPRVTAADVEKREQQKLFDNIARLTRTQTAMLSESESSEVEPADQYVALPLHDVELAAGVGVVNDSEAVGRHLLFRQDWMRKLGLDARGARLARVRGDSMLPLLSDSDLVLVDMTKTELPVEPRRAGAPRRSHLVAIEQDGESRVKWAERPDADTLILHSENTALYGPEIYARPDAERIRLIGRVVWWCHTVPGA